MNPSIWYFARAFVFCFGAVYFFSVVFQAPARTRLACGLIGAVCYTLFVLLKHFNTPILASYFAATTLMAFLCELCAIWLKAPATIFISTSILGLVPGLDLYRTMSLFTLGEYEAGAQIGLQALMAIGAMAMALALSLFVIQIIRRLNASLRAGCSLLRP